MNLISLSKPPIFNFTECQWFLDRGYHDHLHQVTEHGVRKLIDTEEGNVLFEVGDGERDLEMVILEGADTPATRESVRNFVAKWLDLGRDLQPFYQLHQEQNTEWMISDYDGLRLVAIPDLFEALSWSIIGQQINLTFAFKLKNRLIELCCEPVSYEGRDFYLFPDPQKILSLSIQDLRSIQFSGRKAEYLLGIAQLFSNGDLSEDKVKALPDTRAMIDYLCGIRGVGEWSANYVLMKSLLRMDCITHGDTGLQAAVRKHLQIDRKPTREEVIEFIRPFKGWESYMVFYLWRSLSAKS